MWIILNDCFFSIVNKDCPPGRLLVRARRAGDIETLWPKACVRHTPSGDYPYRAIIDRGEIGLALAHEVSKIDYPNFKDSVSPGPLHDAYMQVWSALSSLGCGLFMRRGAPLKRPNAGRKLRGKKSDRIIIDDLNEGKLP